MIKRNEEAEDYIAGCGIHIEEEDYGFCYIGATDRGYLPYPYKMEQDTKDRTEEYYLNAFTMLGYSRLHAQRLGKGKYPEIDQLDCRLAAYRLNYRYGIVSEQYGMTDKAEEIIQHLDKQQPPWVRIA